MAMAPVLHFAVIIAAALLPTLTSAYLESALYAVTVSSQLTGGNKETLCAQLLLPMETPRPICLRVTLEMPSGEKKSLILEEGIQCRLHRCFDFQVPTVKSRTVANVNVVIEGHDKSISKKTKVFILPPAFIHIVRTDKPIYKPGQKVMFRIVSLDTNFIPINRVYKLVELLDPNSNRIAQWLKMHNDAGILDFSHSTIPEAEEGTYIINVVTEQGEKISHNFKIEKFVLPKYEVTVHMPNVVTALDKEITFKICGKYTYGKPVEGSVKAVFCRKGYSYWWISVPDGVDACETYELKTDKSGCATQVVNMTAFFITKYMSIQNFEVMAELLEFGTGVSLTGTGQMDVRSDIRRVTFEDPAPSYKTGLTFDGKVKVTGPDDKPVPNEDVYLSTTYPDKLTITTDSMGMAKFSLDTSKWKDTVTITARPSESKETFPSLQYSLRPRYSSASHRALEFYSKSNSFLKLLQADGEIICDKDLTVHAEYIIPEEELMQGLDSLKFFYLVTSKGEFRQQGHIQVSVEKGVGKMFVAVGRAVDLAPVAQVVVYTVLQSGEVVADSMDFPVQLCFKNKVSLKFPFPQQLPAEKTTLRLQAEPGSLCSVRAIDLSVLLLEDEQDLTVDYVYGQLPLQKLSGFSYEIEDDDQSPCLTAPFPYPIPRPLPFVQPVELVPEPVLVPEPFPLPVEPVPEPVLVPELVPEPVPIRRVRRSFIRFPPYQSDEKNDVYSVFKKIGVKIVTNMDVNKPCPELSPTFFHLPVALEGAPVARFQEPEILAQAFRAAPAQVKAKAEVAKETARTFFPETWIWDLVTVGDDGWTNVNKTVPDTITKWVAGAFCVSPVGFGVSPNTGLTAFKPFFVSLTLPYSVIRGESFTLRATVFNYLSKCIVVKVTLADSKQFTEKKCKGCQYKVCLCGEESRTFEWTVTPTALGQVSLEVSAKALKNVSPCGRKPATIPDKGQQDTVIRMLLVEAEGTPQTVSHNTLLCPADGPVDQIIPLVLPELFVKGSEKATVSVLGDLMGRALKNIDKLLQMPYGCGEQNMLKFAPNIFILKYLESTKQLTQEIQNIAIPFLQAGYQKELQYKHGDGSYSAFGESDKSGNTWLTAFVMKSFAQARQFIYVENKHIDQARAWLSKQQGPDGCIKSVGKLFHNAMKGGVKDDVTLTAYVAAAMLELNIKASDPVVEKCLGCLKTALDGKVDNLYTTALLSYTFTLAKDEKMRSKLIQELHLKSNTEGGTRHWVRAGASKSRLDSLEVEMTSYVLLALLSGPTLPGFELGYSASIIRWLVQQQNQYGGFSSTQDTVVALQALAKYSAATYSKEGKTTVTVTSPGVKSMEFIVDQSNRLLYQEKSLSKVPGEYTVKAEGKSCVLVQISMDYNIPPPPDFSSFTISVKSFAKCDSSAQKLILFVQVSYQGPREETNMVILDIKMLSGYVADPSSLKQLLEEDSVKRVDVETGHAIAYLDALRPESPMMYSLTLEGDAEMEVSNMKPAVVKVYDYYQPSDEAVTEYNHYCLESEVPKKG
ncbi:alpha-2-macroglobulin-like protein 1 [Notolabrus celidotus]|uniref:alpha-2-macroglobulin-like protein 1 n=1 Tax=Notolabrus celidotus TaxID=1203425 RepID=UPI00148F6EFF|nr:alpha-2-macroglobulin-like protein 1 [Notolabrus celidotus]